MSLFDCCGESSRLTGRGKRRFGLPTHRFWNALFFCHIRYHRYYLVSNLWTLGGIPCSPTPEKGSGKNVFPELNGQGAPPWLLGVKATVIHKMALSQSSVGIL